MLGDRLQLSFPYGHDKVGIRHLFLIGRVRGKGMHYDSECPHRNRSVGTCVCQTARDMVCNL